MLTAPTGIPTSRSGSFRKRNPRIDKEIQELQVTSNQSSSRRNSVQDNDEAAALQIEKIRLLEQENLCVVRSFTTSSRGIVNRGDSVKKKRHNPHQQSQEQQQQPSKSSADDATTNPSQIPRNSDAHRVYIIGEQGVGKTALINQFLTSEYMGAAADGTMGK